MENSRSTDGTSKRSHSFSDEEDVTEDKKKKKQNEPGKSFNPNEVQSHESWNYEDFCFGIYCEICLDPFHAPGKIRTHLENKHQRKGFSFESPIACSKCSLKFKYMKGAKEHYAKHKETEKAKKNNSISVNDLMEDEGSDANSLSHDFHEPIPNSVLPNLQENELDRPLSFQSLFDSKSIKKPCLSDNQKCQEDSGKKIPDIEFKLKCCGRAIRGPALAGGYFCEESLCKITNIFSFCKNQIILRTSSLTRFDSIHCSTCEKCHLFGKDCPQV